MNICINCKHVNTPDVKSPEFSRCTFGAQVSPVTGFLPNPSELPYCKVERLPVGVCGPVGSNYEAKNEETIDV